METTTPFVKEDTAKELQNHAGKAQDTWVGAVENAEVAGIECVETMMTAELTEKSELLNLRTRIQFMQVDPEHVDECNTHSQNLAKWIRGAQGTSGNTRTPLLMSRRKTLKHRAEVEAEFHVEEKKAAEIKNQVQTAKNSPDAQQHRAGG